jgi:hypothetical protein
MEQVSEAQQRSDWRLLWLSAIQAFADSDTQQQRWADPQERNPAYSYVECMCTYFDDAYMSEQDAFERRILSGQLSREEAGAAADLQSAESPQKTVAFWQRVRFVYCRSPAVGGRNYPEDAAGSGGAVLSDRHQAALEMREAGATYQAIGDVFGVSASRASAIYQRALILRTEHEVGLRMRSIRVLRGAPHSPEEWAGMLAQDRQKTFLTLLRQPNCDRHHAEETVAWLEAGNLRLP